MRLHLSSAIPADRSHPERNRDLLYTILFVIGAPGVVMGTMYLVDTLFDLLWR